MKKLHLLILLSITILSSVAQVVVTTTSKGKISFINSKGTTFELQNSEGKKPVPNKLLSSDVIAFRKSELPDYVSFEEGYRLLKALKSPYSNTWIIAEENSLQKKFRVSLQSKDNPLRILFENVSTVSSEYIPLSWSSNADIIFFEKVEDDREHEGIYSLDLISGIIEKLYTDAKMTASPVINQDRNTFYYTGINQNSSDYVHGRNELLYSYSISNKQQNVLQHSLDNIVILGIADTLSELHLISKEIPTNSYKNSSQNQLNFRLPWDGGVTGCVTRAGTPSPDGQYSSSNPCYVATVEHSSKVIDFDPDGSYVPVKAVAEGTVIYAQWNPNGLGNNVRIQHPDETVTYYAHLESISVSVGDYVRQGCVVGIMGNTGCNCGAHIHFEWHVGTEKYYAYFDECGCMPFAGFRYTSTNYNSNCQTNSNSNSNTTSSNNVACSLPANLSASEITQTSAKISWTNYDGVCHCKLQYRKSGANSWKKKKVYDSYYYLNNLSYNTMYEYRLQTKCDGNGVSDYSPIQYFTTGNSSYCTTPYDVYGYNFQRSSVVLDWTSFNSIYFKYFMRELGQSNFTEYTGTYKPVQFTGLNSGTSYEFMVSAQCDNYYSLQSKVYRFTTPYFKTDDSATIIYVDSASVFNLNGGSMNPIQNYGTVYIYPNPSSDVVNILSDLPIVKGRLLSLEGKLIQDYPTISNNSLNLPATLATGFYILEIRDSKGKLFSKKIMRE